MSFRSSNRTSFAPPSSLPWMININRLDDNEQCHQQNKTKQQRKLSERISWKDENVDDDNKQPHNKMCEMKNRKKIIRIMVSICENRKYTCFLYQDVDVTYGKRIRICERFFLHKIWHKRFS